MPLVYLFCQCPIGSSCRGWRRRYRKRHEAEEDGGRSGDGDQRGGETDASSRNDKGGRQEGDCQTDFTAVAAVTAAAKAVEEELRGQLEAKDQALRRVSPLKLLHDQLLPRICRPLLLWLCERSVRGND